LSAAQRSADHFNFHVHLAEWVARAARHQRLNATRLGLKELTEAEQRDGSASDDAQAIAVAQAELALAEQQPEQAANLLAAVAIPGVPGWRFRITQLRVEQARVHGDRVQSLRAQLLADLGRAFAEWNDEWLGQTERVLELHALLVDAAEAQAERSPQRAFALLKQFQDQWQAADAELPIRARADQLARALSAAQENPKPIAVTP